MAVDTNQYRSNTSFRVSQLLDETISHSVRLHIGDVVRGQLGMLCDEVDRLRARVAALEAALQPAWKALEGATPGEWAYDDGWPYVWLAPPNGFPRYDLMKSYDLSACKLAAAAVNAVRKAKEAGNDG